MALTKQRKGLKKHEEQLYAPSEPDVNEDFSKLYKVCCVLSRTPYTTFTAGTLTYHSVKWPIQKLGSDYSLTVPPPYSTDIRLDVAIDLSNILCKLPDSMKIIYEKADPKKLINLMLPEGVISSEARKVAAVFWLWLCVTDGKSYTKILSLHYPDLTILCVDILEAMKKDEDFAQGSKLRVF